MPVVQSVEGPQVKSGKCEKCGKEAILYRYKGRFLCDRCFSDACFEPYLKQGGKDNG